MELQEAPSEAGTCFQSLSPHLQSPGNETGQESIPALLSSRLALITCRKLFNPLFFVVENGLVKLSFGPNRAADGVPLRRASGGRDPGESVRNFICVWTNASVRLHGAEMLRKVRPGAAASLAHHPSQWPSPHDGCKQVLENPSFWKAQESYDWRNHWVEGKYCDTGSPEGGGLGACRLVSPSRVVLEQKVSAPGAPARFLGEQGRRQEEMQGETSN